MHNRKEMLTIVTKWKRPATGHVEIYLCISGHGCFLPPFEPAAVRRVAHHLIAHRFRSPPPLIFFDSAPCARPRFMDHPFVRRRRDHFAIRPVTADRWIGSRDLVAILPDLVDAIRAQRTESIE
jgi:hypothetical protein